MFGWEFPPHISGGLGTASYGIVKGLSQIGTKDIIFVVPKAYGDEDQSSAKIINAGDINVTRRIVDFKSFFKSIKFIEIGSNIVAYASPEEYENLMNMSSMKSKELIYTHFHGQIPFKGGYGESLYQEIANYAVIAYELGKTYTFDIIHAHDWVTYPAGIAAKHASGKPLVVHVHATDFDRSGGSVNPAVYEIEKNGMHEADKIIAVSNLTRKTIIEKYGISPDKVVTVHNAVEPDDEEKKLQYKRKIDDKIVTFLGRITMQKGPSYFIEAAAKVLTKMQNVRFVMAGSGELMRSVINHAASKRIGHHFHFTGFLKGDDVTRMFSLSDVYVMPSVSEPFGISPLEAMRSNVPVIISKQSGVSEVLKHAIKVDFWDVDAIADAIYGILNYKGLKMMFDRLGKEEVEDMTWDKTAKKINDIYTKLIQN